MEMGSLVERTSHDFVEEILISPENAAPKAHSFDAPQLESSRRHRRVCGRKILDNSVFLSIRVVVFSNKLNLLMPFGPLAILVHALTNHNVSFYILLHHLLNLYIYGIIWVFLC